MLIDDGLVVRDDGGREDAGWTPVGDLSSIAVPPSVAALLAARLERLSDDERRAIGSASVIGKNFYLGAARELLPEPDRANAGPLVRSLVRKELVRETRSTIPGEDAFEFRHILIRDAAYAAIPKERRAEQHRRFADWCVRIAGERIEELEEIVGYHLEQAFRNRESIGALDEDARALAIEASARLESAGMRAFDRPDMAAAANLLRRAETLLPPDDPGRVVILTTLAYCPVRHRTARRSTGHRRRGRSAGSGRRRSRGGRTRHDRALAAGRTRCPATGADEGGREKGDRGVRGGRRPARTRPGVEPPREYRVVAGPRRGAARRGGARVGTRPGRNRPLRGARGPREPHRGARQGTDPRLGGHRPRRANDRGVLGEPRGRRVHVPCARALPRSARRVRRRTCGDGPVPVLLSDTGQTLSYLRSVEVAFDVAMLAGEAEHACDLVEEASRSLADLGDSWPYLAAFLGQGRYAVGRYEDAREPAAFAAEHGDEVEGSLALGVLAKLAARSGDAPTALETIAEAVARVDPTDFLFDRGTVHTDRAETLRLLGREDEALSAFDEAIGLFDQKGDLVSSERVRRLRAEAAR